jgi:hypothetical protein
MNAPGVIRRRSLILALVAGGLVMPAGASELAVYARMFEDNRLRLRDYTWVSRTELTLDGERQSVSRQQVRFDEKGNQLRTALPLDPDDAAGPVKRRSRKREKQQQRLRDDLRSLIESYVHPNRETTRQIFEDAFVWRGEDRNEALTRVQARHVVRQGDQVSLWLDSITQDPTRLEILTSSGGEPVRVITEFERIEQGPFYPSSVVVETEIKEKKVIMATENGDYRRLDSREPD